MERFVELIVSGGVALVAGLWVTTGFAWGTAPWAGGVAVVIVGALALAAGIGSELEL